MSSHKPHEAFSECGKAKERVPTFSIRRESFEDKTMTKNTRAPAEFRELDTMDSLVHRMIGEHEKIPIPAGGDGIQRSGTIKKEPVKVTLLPVGPDDPADVFYPDEVDKAQKGMNVEDTLAGRKKRWSNPMGLLKGPLKEGLRGLMYSSR
jgi:hypothetical protein